MAAMSTPSVYRSVAAILLLAPLLRAQSAENVLLVLNEASPVSLEIGQYYASKRAVPKGNILRIETGTEDSIPREQFARRIEAPIAAWLARNSAQDRILYIVLTKGIPLRVEGTSGQQGTVACVDSELTLLYRKMTGQQVPVPGWVNNPYFLGDAPVAQARRFSHEEQDLYLVTRLDGYTGADIRGLIDRGVGPSADGRILLDEKDSLSDKGNVWLRLAAANLRGLGFQDRVVLESTEKVLSGETGVLGYYSWGSNDPSIHIRHFNLSFVPGALAGMFVSSDGRTFREPPADWKIGTWEDKSSYYERSPQSLAGDLIRDGVTGVAGHVAEPYLEATVRPDALFPAYISGFNLAESYYLAIPYLSWQTVVVGDPLCAPFRKDPLSSEAIDKGLDPVTELPRSFSNRRFRALSVPLFRQAGVSPESVKVFLRAETRLTKGDTDGAREALEEATAKDNRFGTAILLLAGLYEKSGEYDKAIARYRAVLQNAPNQPLALNNLAYALAVHKSSPDEALPLAERAYALAKDNANIMDTLGWILHLVGQKDRALELLSVAVEKAPQNAELRLHAASCYLDAGKMEEAARELNKAIELDSELGKREDVLQLKRKLETGKN